MAEKRENFKRLATLRTRNALKQISLIGNLSNKNNYEYTDEDVRKIFVELDRSLRETRSKFYSRRDKEFKL